jgi:pSer/pThr/pTyr-binding forkhead associated (FHA) protein
MSVKLSVVQGRPAGKSLLFPVGEYFIGRGAECHIRPDSDCVSRQHCMLRVTAESAFIRDLGSRNGTLVNGALLNREHQLHEGDRVQLGPLVFEVHFDTSAASAPEKGAIQTGDKGPLRPTAEIPVFQFPPDGPLGDTKDP